MDLVAGRGIGAVGALFAAIDGASRLWEPAGLWRRPRRPALYPWRPALRRLARRPGAGRGCCWSCRAGAGAGRRRCIRWRCLLDAVGTGAGAWLAAAVGGRASRLHSRPTGCRAAAAAGGRRAPRSSRWLLALRARARAPAPPARARGGVWWAVLGAPLAARPAVDYFVTGLWDLLRGGAGVKQPARLDLEPALRRAARREPRAAGFRELLSSRTISTRARTSCSRCSGAWRRPFFCAARRQVDRRSAEAVDLAGAARDQILDAVAGGADPAGRDRAAARRLCRPRATGAARRTG